MDGFFADHAVDSAFFCNDFHFTGRNIEFVNAAIRAEVQETVIGDIDDLKTDFIVMACEHDTERSFRIENSHCIAENICLNIITEFADVISENCGGFFFIS